MRNFLSILVLMLCQFYVANAQKCLVSFGVNEEVTEMPIENALYTLYLNDSIQVPYKVTYADVQSATLSSLNLIFAQVDIPCVQKKKVTMKCKKISQ